MKLWINVLAGGLLAAGAPALFAQPQQVKEDVVIAVAPVAMAPQADTVRFLAAEAGFEGKVVTGAPYSAEGVTESTRILQDGTRIVHKTTSAVARDSQGRTRREQRMHMAGPWMPAGEAPVFITLHDPVAKEHILLDPKEKTARKTKIAASGVPGNVMFLPRHGPGVAPAQPAGEVRVERNVQVFHREAAPGMPVPAPEAGHVMMWHHDSRNAKTESLGKQAMEGLAVEGTRTTHTIPAGTIGNDRPIVSVTERWVSPELQVTVMSRTNDPQSGETIYRLTGISRAEPPKDLFQIPPGYTVKEGEPVIRRLHVEEKK